MKPIGKLSFDFSHGACSNQANKRIIVCFDAPREYNHKKCWMADGPLEIFWEILATKYSHRLAKIASNDGESILHSLYTVFSDKTLTVGAYGYGENSKKAEWFSTKDKKWEQLYDYPGNDLHISESRGSLLQSLSVLTEYFTWGTYVKKGGFMRFRSPFSKILY